MANERLIFLACNIYSTCILAEYSRHSCTFRRALCPWASSYFIKLSCEQNLHLNCNRTTNLLIANLCSNDFFFFSFLNISLQMYKLLYQIANPSNIEVIAEKLLYQLENSLDKYWRSEVISMVMNLSKR